MSTITDKLALYGVTLEMANAVAHTYFPSSLPSLVADTHELGITGAELGEILGYAPGATSAESHAALRGDLLDCVGNGYLEAYIDLCVHIGIGVQQIAAAFDVSAAEVVAALEFFGADWTDLPGSIPDVSTVSSTSVAEGESSVQTVTLTAETIGTTHLVMQVTGELQDVNGYSLSNGVQLGLGDVGLEFIVPAGVSSFTITLNTAENTTDETGDSDARTISINVDGVIGTATITDDDTPAVSEEPFLPYQLMPLADDLRLNGQSGTLATAAMRADIIAQTNEDDYWALFDATGYAGAGDGVFTNAEIGWTLGDVPVTPEMMESLFFGTLVHALKAIDEDEFADIGMFLFNATAVDGQLDATEFGLLVLQLDEAFSSPAEASFFSDSEIRTAIVEAGVELVGMVDEEPSFFHGLINVFA